jgi:hypothetical protein
MYENPAETLKAAIAARRASLEVLTKDNAPTDWANSESGLGICLLNLSNFVNDASLLKQALAAFEASKEVFTRETLPAQWAFAENNIGDVHWSLATRGGGKADFEEAIARFESAKEAFVEIGYLPVIPIVDKKIALIKDMLAKP